MKKDTTSEEIKQIKNVKNPADNYRKTLFNYDLEIANVISQSKFFAAREEMYRDDKTTKGKNAYYQAVITLRKLQTFLNALKQAKNETWEDLDKIVSRYNSKYKKIWLLYFIEDYTIQEVAEAIPYDLRNLKRIIKSMKQDLITYLPYECIAFQKGENIDEDEEESEEEEATENGKQENGEEEKAQR